MQAKWVVPVWCAIAVCLAGCGHKSGSTTTPTVNGGGGGGGNPIVVPSTLQAANTSGPAFGAASAPAIFTTGSGFVLNYVTPNPADSASGATVTLTTNSSGNLTAIDVTAPVGGGLSFSGHFPSFNGAFASPITLNQLVVIMQQELAGALPTFIYQGPEGGLTASAYGAWVQNNNGGNFAFGPVAFGNETTTPQMTTLAGAGLGLLTYNGSTFGLGATNGTPFAFTGAATITANFGTQAVTAQFSGLNTANLSGVGSAITLPTFSGSGTIGAGVNPNQYLFALAGTGFTGNVTGTFYGTTAHDTAGVWQATNGTGTSLSASFGAHR